jgi:hypothetical protein
VNVDASDLRAPESSKKTACEVGEDTTLADRVAVVCACTAGVAAVTGGFAFGGANLLGLALGPLLGAALGHGSRQRFGLALLGALSCAPLLLWGFELRFAQAAMGAALGLTMVTADRWRRRRSGVEAASGAAEAATVVLASLAVVTLFSEVTAAPAGPAQSALRAIGAAGAGLLVALTLLPLHVRALRDRVAAALRTLRPIRDVALRSHLHDIVRARRRVLRLLTRSCVDRGMRRETQRGLDALALTAIELAERFDPVHEVLERFGPNWLAERTARLQAQRAVARDPGVRAELERCIEALSEKQVQLRAIAGGRERLLARLETELAAVERAELTLAVHALGSASSSGLRLENVGDELARQADDLQDDGLELQIALAELSSRGGA